MNPTHEVISAFLDDAPFDPQELAHALDDSTGRALLIDLVVLRRIVQPTDAMPAIRAANPAWRHPWRIVAAAAMLFLAIGGGYLAGGRRAVTTPSAAPAPTRIVEAVPFTPAGGMR